MTTITVHKDNREVTRETINQEYCIIETSSGELFWFEKEIHRAGTIKIWLQIRENTPLLCFVLPDWQLIIDNVWMEKKFYEDIEDLKGKTVELRYKEYSFVFQFEK